jgi:hypothetical protein
MATPEVSTPSLPAQDITSKQLLGWFWRWSHPLRPRRKSAAERLSIYRTRRVIFERSNGLCEKRVSPKCERFITWRTMHSAHIVSAARGGAFEPSNLLASCGECHTGWQHNGGKPCPPKPKAVKL